MMKRIEIKLEETTSRYSIFKQRKKVSIDQISSDTDSSPTRRGGLTPLRIFRVLLVASIAYPTSLALRWSALSTRFCTALMSESREATNLGL